MSCTVIVTSEETADKTAEQRAFEFASHLLLPNSQLKRAFEGQSMVRLLQFKERFGISLAAMVYRAEKLGFVPKSTAKMLWIEFARRGWKTNEPGSVRPDRATRFEQLIDEALVNRKLSLKELADLAGVGQKRFANDSTTPWVLDQRVSPRMRG